MLDFIDNLIEHMVAKADAASHAIRRAQETRRLDRLYGSIAPRQRPSRLDGAAQSSRLAQIVRTHCAAGTHIVETHASAAIALDSAEYNLASMLQELRGVMTKLPTEWAPDYARVLPGVLIESADIQARAA